MRARDLGKCRVCGASQIASRPTNEDEGPADLCVPCLIALIELTTKNICSLSGAAAWEGSGPPDPGDALGLWRRFDDAMATYATVRTAARLATRERQILRYGWRRSLDEVARSAIERDVNLVRTLLLSKGYKELEVVVADEDQSIEPEQSIRPKHSRWVAAHVLFERSH